MALRAGFHGTVGQPSAQVINGSLKFEKGSSQSLSRTPSSAGNRRTFTISYWIKRTIPVDSFSPTTASVFGAEGGSEWFDLSYYTVDEMQFITNAGVGDQGMRTSAKYRDFSNFYHVCAVVDTTQSTAADRMKIYVNGVYQTQTIPSGMPSQNYETYVNSTNAHHIGRDARTSSIRYGDHYLSQFYLIDGQALTPESFGFTDPLTNTWRPKKYTGTFGTNGFYLPMDNQDDFEIDKSGNGNNWTKTNFTGTFNDPDVIKDSPSGAVFGGRGQTGITTTSSAPSNYATWNPLKMGTSDVSMSEGNLFWRTTSNGPDKCTYSTIGMDSGKFYWENEIVEATATAVGIANILANQDAGPGTAHNWMYYSATGQVYLDGSASSYGDAYNTNGTIIGVAFDRDNLTLEFYKNGVSQGKLTSISGLTDSETYYAMCGDSGGASQSQVRVNFGQKPFKYAPPQGFLPLNSASARPETVFARPDQYVGIVTYVGDDATTHPITGLNFGAVPDFVWIKNRNQSEKHILHDTVRGVGDTLYSTSNDHDTGSTYSDRYKSFDLNGFTVGSTHTSTNSNGDDFSAVCWKAGGSSNTFNVDGVGYASAADAGLDGGDLTVTGASVGTKQGFSIIKYQGSGTGGDQVPHGLSQTPNLAFVKQAGNSGSGTPWDVYHSGYYAAGSKNYLRLNNDDGAGYAADMFQTPTSSFMTFGSSNSQNGSSYNYIMYCWHDVPGLQKFGSYTGNGSDDGPFIETGFRPTLIWTRAHTGSGITNNAGWFIYDTLDDSNPYNDDSAVNKPGNYITYAHLLNPLQSHASMGIDILSNGFRLRADPSAYSNYDGWDYIYGAFAAAPVSNLYGGQSNAR